MDDYRNEKGGAGLAEIPNERIPIPTLLLSGKTESINLVAPARGAKYHINKQILKKKVIAGLR